MDTATGNASSVQALAGTPEPYASLLAETRWHLGGAADSLTAGPHEIVGVPERAAEAVSDRRVRGCMSAARAVRASLRLIALTEGVDTTKVLDTNVDGLADILLNESGGAVVDMVNDHVIAFGAVDFWCEVDPATCVAGLVLMGELSSKPVHMAATLSAAVAADLAVIATVHALRERPAVADRIADATKVIRCTLPERVVADALVGDTPRGSLNF